MHRSQSWEERYLKSKMAYMIVKVCLCIMLAAVCKIWLSVDSIFGFVSLGVIDGLKSQVGKTQVGVKLCSSSKPKSLDLF